MIIGVILASGASRRMGGHNKALVALNGQPLIRHVIHRLSDQVDRLVINHHTDFGTGLPTAKDDPNAVKGPVAGLYAGYQWAKSHKQATAIVTAPVDTPFLPCDLVARLTATGGPAIASARQGLQPTFGYWPLSVLQQHVSYFNKDHNPSLRALATKAGAIRIEFPDEQTFFNINQPADLIEAERLAKTQTTYFKQS